MADIVPDGTNFIKGSYKNAAGSRAYRLFTPSGYHGPAIHSVGDHAARLYTVAGGLYRRHADELRRGGTDLLR
jgi:hypothetical protein